MARTFSTVDDLLREAASLAPPAADVARAAVFDADGTLWRGDIGDAAFEALPRAGLLRSSTWAGPVRDWAQRFELALPDDPALGVEHILAAARSGALARSAAARGLDDGSWRAALYGMQAWILAGATRDEIEVWGEQLFADGFERQIFEDMRALLRGLEALGIEVWIASASHGALVAPGARRLGVARHRALGMEPAVGSDGRTLPHIAVHTFGAGKAAAVRRALGDRRPLLAFGDSVLSTDKELLASAQQGVAVAPRAAHREAATASDTLWLFDPTQ